MESVRPILLGVSLVLFAAGAQAQLESDRIVTLEIKSQVLRDALNDWAQQTGFQLISRSSEVTRRVVVPTIAGSFSARAALEQLLKGTPLTYELLDERTVVIRERVQPESATNLQRIAYAAEAPKATAQGARAEAASRPFEVMDEVIVTAQRRVERLQDVPISISVLSGEKLDAFAGTGVTEAMRSVPGIAATVHNQGGGTQVSLRGVAANRALFGGSSPIIYYLDAVPFGFVRSAAAPDSSAYDLARVEVLRGPQGTLYGASALNGVVRVLTHDVDLEKVELTARTSYSATTDGDDSYRADAALNIPIIEGKFGGRLVAGYQDVGGWVDRANDADSNDAQIGNYRLRLRADPIEDLSVGLSAWFSRSDYGARPTSRDDRTSTASIAEPVSTDYDVYSLTIRYDFPAFTLQSATGSLSYDNKGLQDLRPLGLNTQLFTGLSSDVVTQEISLSSKSDGAWRWTAGGIYREGEDRIIQTTPGLSPPSDSKDRSEYYAVFAELTRLVLDGRLELTGGLRYFEDSVGHSETLPVVYESEDDFDKVSPRAVLTWHAGDDATLYASYSEGFRSSSLQFRSVIATNPAFAPPEPDTLKNYEVGSKGNFWGGRVRFDTAIYYVDWQDVQMNLSVLVNGIPTAALTNGESASGYGVDFAVTTELAERLQFGVSVGWNDLTSDTAVRWSNALGTFDLLKRGDRLNYSPEITASATLDYTWSFAGGYEAGLALGGDYMSKQDFHNVVGTNTVNYGGESITTARASFSITAPQNWRATLFIENATDEDRPLIGATFGDPNNASHLRPRTYGLQLAYRL